MTRHAVRVAGVDMGSNTTRLIVADVHRHDGGSITHTPLVRRSVVTRLAEGVDRRGILLPAPITRVRSALVAFRREATEAGAVFVLATATSAVRDADNGDAFLGEVEHGFGFRAELLTGSDEALTAWAGVSSDPILAAEVMDVGSTGLLVDIGGGSTEVVLVEGGRVRDHHSFQLGSVRLTERCVPGGADHPGPIAPETLAQMRAAVKAELGVRFPDPSRPSLAIGVAGTCTTSVAVRDAVEPWDAGRVHLSTLTPDDVATVVQHLAACGLEQRRAVPGLETARAPVICGGLVVLEAVLAHFQVATLTVSCRDILDGIALRAGAVALDEGIDELPEPFGRTCC